MSSQLRKCKECGKTFLPKGREQYCPDIHYRPCPICGAPVEAKYLSDPPRKCDKCKGKKSSQGFKNIPSKMMPPSSNKETKENKLATPVKSENTSWMKEIESTASQPTVDSNTFCENVTGTVMMYIGNQYKNNFQKGHKYLIKVEHSDYVYNVTSVEDVTSGDDCDIILPIASQISFYQKFARVKENVFE